MKKFLVILVALALVLGVASTAMAADKQIPDYSDTTTTTKYASDIYRLTALGVLEGNTGWGGAYRPTDKLTRAEFAKIACYMFGKQDYVSTYAAQKSAFSDVSEGFWAEGWINCAKDNGLMIGVGGGKFNPNAPVTKQEVATATLRAVGYTDALPGAWPSDYISKSQKVHTMIEDDYKDRLSLYDYVQKIDGTVATRAEMAAIVNYCLDLYRVEYVGHQTIVAGLDENIDVDGFRRVEWATNEPRPGSLTDRKFTFLLWDVFKAWVEPTWQFQKWQKATPTMSERFVEASGWGYEDLAEGELVFKGNKTYSVASDYYIFDPYLDGQLWQLGARCAFLTVRYDRNATGYGEALFADMISDVNYIDEETEIELLGIDAKVEVANADVFSKPSYREDGNYAIYYYDDFNESEIAIVKDIADHLITVVGSNRFGEANGSARVFCILDDCKKPHDKNYVFLKDGKLQDASCLKVNDVVYKAGALSEGKDGESVDLYIAYTPKAATFTHLKNGLEYLPHFGGITLNGVEYGFCNTYEARRVSYDGGFKDGNYWSMYYSDLYDKLTEKDFDGSCLFAPAYAKKYVASLIFEGPADTRKYGVFKVIDTANIPPQIQYKAIGGTFFGPDGEDDKVTLTEPVLVGVANGYWGDNFLGALGNYWPDEDNKIDPYETGSVYGDYTIGAVNFDPNSKAKVTVHTNENGRFPDADKMLDTTDSEHYVGVGSGYISGTEETFVDKFITADTVIFEVTTKWQQNYYDGSDEQVFKSVKLGKVSRYLNAAFSVQQMNIFEWDETGAIKVLYVVNPHFNGDLLAGLFDTSKADKDGGYLEYEDGTKLYFSDNQGKWPVPDERLVYGLYKTEDDEIQKLYINGKRYVDDNMSAAPAAAPIELAAGDFVALYGKYGQLTDTPDKVVDVIKKNIDKATAHEFNLTFGVDAAAQQFNKNSLHPECEYIDLSGDGKFGKETFTDNSNHADQEKYLFAITKNQYGEIIQVFRYLPTPPIIVGP